MDDLPDRDEDEGTFKPSFDDPEDLLEFLEPGETYSRGDVADIGDVSPKTAYNYLTELAERGAIEKIRVHDRQILWKIPE